ncbi:MAG: DUF4258 domain-containing protein [ANME-2 cluster archaeon]|nr:DUF4258 domain-containing protein [ANME-2 cluster archaeon]
MEISDIKSAIHSDRIRITDHSDEEAQNDKLSYNEIFQSVLTGMIIEDYFDDKPYPSCLIYGNTYKNEPVHSVWAYNEQTKWAVLVTVYRPDPSKWENWQRRKE